MLNQLMEHGSLLKAALLKLYGSLRDFTEELREEFRRHRTSEPNYEALLAEAYQIRLDTSWRAPRDSRSPGLVSSCSPPHPRSALHHGDTPAASSPAP